MTHPAPRKPDADEPHRVDGPHQVDGDSVDVDQALAARCTSHGDYLAGLIATAMLDTAARPDRLPETLFPDADPTLVRAIWNTALPVGYHAGLIAAHPRWAPDTLTRAHHDLARAGYAAMAHLAARSANTHHRTTPRPPDTPQGDQP